MTLEVGDRLSATQRVESLKWLKSRGWTARDNTGARYYQRGPGHGKTGPSFRAGLWTLGTGATHILKPWPDPPEDAEPRKPLAAVSAKKAQEIRGSRPVVAEVFERDGGCVLRWRTDLWGPCDGPLDPHHILRQSAGGEWTREGLLTLCRIHHQWVTENPAAATAHGLSVSRLADLDEAHTLRLVFGIGIGITGSYRARLS